MIVCVELITMIHIPGTGGKRDYVWWVLHSVHASQLRWQVNMFVCANTDTRPRGRHKYNQRWDKITRCDDDTDAAQLFCVGPTDRRIFVDEGRWGWGGWGGPISEGTFKAEAISLHNQAAFISSLISQVRTVVID